MFGIFVGSVKLLHEDWAEIVARMNTKMQHALGGPQDTVPFVSEKQIGVTWMGEKKERNKKKHPPFVEVAVFLSHAQ